MILQQLCNDAKGILGEQIAPPMYDNKPVRWEINLAGDGVLLHFIPLGDKDSKRGWSRLVPYPGPRAGTVIRPSLLVDTAPYVLGIAPDDHRVDIKHAAFKALVHKCAEETQDAGVRAVDAFLAAWNPAQRSEVPAELTPADLLTFKVDGQSPVDAPAVRAFWARTARPESDAGTGFVGECLVTGQVGPIDASLPGMIKRVPGGQTSGIALISANAPAFESHGWERAQTSPVSRVASETFTKALNHLIADDKTHLTVGDLVYVFWTNKGGDDLMAEALINPGQVRDMLQGVWTGQATRYLPEDAFHALALSASGARAVVRDWLSTTVGHAYDNLRRWFDAQAIVAPNGGPGQEFGVRTLAHVLYRDARKEMTAQAPEALIHAALHGGALPRSLLARAVGRCRVEQAVPHARAALLKAIVNTNFTLTARKENEQLMTPGLDENNRDPAYICGRLLALLDTIQYQAQGNINVTVADRFFGAAAASPRRILGTVLLEKATKAHLPKLRRTKPGAYVNRTRELEALLGLISPEDYPPSLPLERQAIFMLGFYHQCAHMRASRPAKGAAAAASTEDDTHDPADDDTQGE